jgi:NADPH-dependent 2,4-dienoyl-CoA reductase/sulfur reductase-like enzyme
LRRILIIGASLAGVNAAQALREAGFAGEVILLGDEGCLPYDRPPLSKEALASGDVPPAELRPAAWYADNGIELRLGARALALDAWRRRVTLADGAEAGYDGLIIATGAEPRPLPAPLRAAGVITLRRPEDAAALRSLLAPGVRVVVIGAGFIGLEVAATARSAGARVTVAEVATAPLARAFGEQVGDWLARRHRDAGADVRCGQPVRAVIASGLGYRVVLGDGAVLHADVVVAAAGVSPGVDWLRGSGLRLGDGVLCDAYCRTSAPGVVAAGDVARWYNPLFDEDMRVEHWTNAVEQGRAAALTLLGEGAPYAPVPYFWSDQHGMRIRFAGRAYAASEVWIEDRGNGSMVALYERDGLIRGALCVDALRDLAIRRRQILDRERWADVVPARPAAPSASPRHGPAGR